MPRGKVPASPLPQRDGVDATRIRLPGQATAGEHPWPTILAYLQQHLAVDADVVAAKVAAGEFLHADGSPVTADEPYRVGYVWVDRPFPDEHPAPHPPVILYRDERIVVVDKPHFMASNPQGSHLVQTAQALTRVATGIPTLTPAHRLDRVTAGVLMFTTTPEFRQPYQQLFQEGQITKTYLALVHTPDDLDGVPRTRSSHIVKSHWSMQVIERFDVEPNAHTQFEVLRHDREEGKALLRVSPTTGRTHQIRAHLAGLGIGIVNDPLYPEVTEYAGDSTWFNDPLQLLAESLEFTDPVDGSPRRYLTRQHLK